MQRSKEQDTAVKIDDTSNKREDETVKLVEPANVSTPAKETRPRTRHRTKNKSKSANCLNNESKAEKREDQNETLKELSRIIKGSMVKMDSSRKNKICSPQKSNKSNRPIYSENVSLEVHILYLLVMEST